MSITLIKGRPGAGKSYECVVHHILPALKDGRKVVTNIPLNVEHFVRIFGHSVKDLLVVEKFSFDNSSGSRGELLTRYNDIRNSQIDNGDDDPLPEVMLDQICMDSPNLAEPIDYVSYLDWRNSDNQGVLFVIDECHFHFPLSGRGKSFNELAERQIKFFSGHRHYGFDFIFLTQSDRKINRLLREDIEICIEVRKNRAMGDKSYRRYVFYYGDGKKGGLIEQDSRTYEDKWFPFYKSHTKSDGEVKEAKIKDMKKWHQHWGIRIPLLMMLFGGVWAFKNISHAFSPEPAPAKSVQHDSNEDKQPRVKIPPQQVTFKGVPFGGFEIFIEGYSDSSYVDKNGVYHLQKQVYFSATNEAKYKLDLKLDDFYLAGYQVSVYGPCMVRLSYEDASKLVYCRGKQPEKRSSEKSALDSIVAS